MEYVECRTHDTICIGERIRLTVVERQRDGVTLAVVAGLHSHVRFGHDALRAETVDAAHARYLLPLLTGDCFTVDDIRVGVGLYLDRHEISANDDCDIQLQISRVQLDRTQGDRMRTGGPRSGSAAVNDGPDEGRAAADAVHTPDRHAAEGERGIRIRCLRAAPHADGERSAPCSP